MHLFNLSQLYKFIAEFINKVSYHSPHFIFRSVFSLSMVQGLIMMQHLKIMANLMDLAIICFNH